MENKSTVMHVKENVRSYESKFGTMYVHEIQFMDGNKGEYSSKSAECKAFKEGEDCKYTIEERVNGKFTNYIIKPVREVVYDNKGYTPKDPQQEKHRQALIVAQSSMTKAVELAIAGHIKIEQIKEAAIKFSNYVYEIADLKANDK